jgi:hypothetical protein
MNILWNKFHVHLLLYDQVIDLTCLRLDK